MWLKGSFSSAIKKELQNYQQIKIFVDQHGNIVKIEKEKNGILVTDNFLRKLFDKLPNHLQIKKNLIITLKQ